MTTISADTALAMALAATKALSEEIHNHEETKRLTVGVRDEELDKVTTERDWYAAQSANLQEKVDMREMTIRQTVQKNKELGDELSDCSAEILRLQKQVLYAESNGHQALANYRDSLQRCIDTAWGHGRHSHTLFTRSLQAQFEAHDIDFTLGRAQ